jgi:hypothetical protein
MLSVGYVTLNDWWIEKDSGGNDRGLIEVLSRNLSGRTVKKKTWKNIANGMLTEIRIGRAPNASLESFRCGNMHAVNCI